MPCTRLYFNYLAWCESDIFPKSRKSTCTDARKFRSISLTLLLIKALKTVILIHKGYLPSCLSISLQQSKFTEAAHYELTAKIKKSVYEKENIVDAFIGIECAFDYTSFIAISERQAWHRSAVNQSRTSHAGDLTVIITGKFTAKWCLNAKINRWFLHYSLSKQLYSLESLCGTP